MSDHTLTSTKKPLPLIVVYFDDSEFTDEEITLVLEYLSEAYRELGGSGLKTISERSGNDEGSFPSGN